MATQKVMKLVFCLLIYAYSSVVLAQVRDVASDMKKLDQLMPKFTVKVYAQADPEKPGEGLGTGSGELISSTDGVVRILTNFHVVGPRTETVYVHFDGQPFAQLVRVIGRDPAVDLALLEAPSPLPDSAAPIAITRKQIAIGDTVYAIGYPSGNRTISSGVINSLTSLHEDFGNGMYFTHQAPIAPGSSGGLLVRFTSAMEPEMVGVNTQVGAVRNVIVSVGYSLKHEVILRMLSKLENGLVAHARLGVIFADTARANPYAFGGVYPPSQTGIAVTAVDPTSPAGRAGIQRGDMIKKFEKQIGGRWENHPLSSAAALRDLLFFDMTPGTVVRVTTLRGKEELQRTLTLETLTGDGMPRTR